MDRLAVLGLSLRETDLEGLERLEQRFAGDHERGVKTFADLLGASEVVCLSTCNRFEVVYARESGELPGREDGLLFAEASGLAPADALRLFHYRGARAARHVFRVAASLDSLVVGEGEILGQVREAFATCARLGLVGPILGPLFEHALALGKAVRSETDLCRHPVSVVSLATSSVVERAARSPTEPRIAVIGAGATAAHAARSLRAAGLPVALIANRSLQRARQLAAEVGARAVKLASLREARERIDVLVSATSSPDFVLDAAALRRLAARTPSGDKLLAVDLALPRDLEPLVDERIERIDLDALGVLAEANRTKRAAAVVRAEELIEAKLCSLGASELAGALSAPYAALLAEARETLEIELARLCAGRLARLDERDRRAIERWARLAFGRIAHGPFAALKRFARASAGSGNADEAGSAALAPEGKPWNA